MSFDVIAGPTGKEILNLKEKISQLEREKDDQYQAFQKWKKDYFTKVKELERDLAVAKEALEGMFHLLDSEEPLHRQIYLKSAQEALSRLAGRDK